jgi:hypothetical protein
VISDAEVKAFFASKEPEPKPTYSDKDKKWAIGMLTAEPQLREVYHQTINAKLKSKVTWPRQKEAGNKFHSLENRRINRSPRS